MFASYLFSTNATGVWTNRTAVSDLGVGCVYDGKNICCVNPLDGDVNNPECRNGVSYAYWKPGEKVKYYGHLEKSIKNSFDKEGIKETVAK